jgi:phenylphosphate carboxylase beta subunit
MKDLSDWIATCEKAGELRRITTEVDWNLELSHVSVVNERKKGPALLFENVKGYDIPVLSSAITSYKRMALTLGLPTDFTMCDMARAWMKASSREPIKPVEVKDGAVMEEVIEGEKVNLYDFPAPHLYPLDGGRFIGTTAFLITEDPDTGWTNLGLYRMQILDEKSNGIQIIKGKHADFTLKKYEKMGKKMPAAVVIGGDPILFLAACTAVPAGTDEYDLAGALRGAPVEVIRSDLTGLKLPAHAEIILEGEIDPMNFRPEGPLGEYTGYYSGMMKLPKPWLNVKRVLRRKHPIFWMTTVAGRGEGGTNIVYSMQRTAGLWADLEAMHVPGIQSVYMIPQAANRFWAVVSVKTMYPGHANHVGNAVIATSTGHYGVKGVIVVDADIAADDLDGVWWALGTRFNPVQDAEILKRGRSTPLDPALPVESRDIVSRIILDATTPYEWKEKPVLVELDEDVEKRVLSRWPEYGLD